MTTDPNIIFIVLDTVRARNLSLYGHSRETTPHLEDFAEESVTFEHAYSPSNWTVASHGSIFTGTNPWVNKTGRQSNKLHPQLETLSGTLSDHGYTTIGLSNNIYVSPQFGFDRGFDHFEFNQKANGAPFSTEVTIHSIREKVDNSNPFPIKALEILRYIREEGGRVLPTSANWLARKFEEVGIRTRYDTGAEWAIDRAEREINKSGKDPLYMYINLMEGHTPYFAPEKHLFRYMDEYPEHRGWGDIRAYYEELSDDKERTLNQLQDLYDGSIHYLDSQLNRLVKYLREKGEYSDTVIVIAGDHGEAFGEHSLYGHRTGLTNELIRVPLLIKTPDRGSEVRQHPVSLQWIMPTLLNLINIDTPANCQDVSLFNSNPPPVVAEANSDVFNGSAVPGYEHYEKGVRAIIEDDMKLITDEEKTYSRLYNISDKYEETDLSSMRENIVDDLFSSLEEIIENSPDVPRNDDDEKLPESVESQLRELGYV